MKKPFNYDLAFSRNIGWLTETEQAILRNKRIAIAGLGGVGGSHLITLVRLGIGKFNVSDLDVFELANFNRQAGAALSHVSHPKTEVMAELASDINPELEIRTFPNGVNLENLDEFLADVDLYVDGLDFFAIDVRRAVFAACAVKGIPAITAAPLGMGASLLCFLPGKMTFEDYFKLEGHSKDAQLLRFLLGLSPAMLQMPYLVDDSRVDLANHKGPSTPMACELCAGIAASHALKILLNRGPVPAAPTGVHFDAYRNKLASTWRPWGNSNPLQLLGLKIARKKLSSKVAISDKTTPNTPLARILDLARWAPSGDNTQPWRFEIINDLNFLVYANDTRDWCVYDLDGHSSQTAVGALLETIAIAASGEGLQAVFKRRKDCPEIRLIIEVVLSARPGLKPSPLLPFIKGRVTQRRAFSSIPLTNQQKKLLELAAGEQYQVIWLEGKQKRQMAKLLYRSAQIHLSIPEGYQVHKRIIEWNARFSRDRIPDQAIGLDPLALRLMQWALKSWTRVNNLNRYFAGTFIPRLQLNLIPALRCAAHFALVSKQPLEDCDDYFAGGRALQRFWLTATSLGLQLQPEMAPLIFSRYTMMSKNFTHNSKALQSAQTVAAELNEIIGAEFSRNRLFIGRIGIGGTPKARSVRLAFHNLLVKSS